MRCISRVRVHVWQSRVENEHYSVAYFDHRISVKDGARMHYVEASH